MDGLPIVKEITPIVVRWSRCSACGMKVSTLTTVGEAKDVCLPCGIRAQKAMEKKPAGQ